MKLYYDLHLHSCLSPCASEDMTPANIAAMCTLAGLNVVALTDHNSTGNCAAFCEACGCRGLLALPGMELTTAEEIHVLCLFPDLDASAAFGALVGRHQMHVGNDSRIFGSQLYMDSGDGVLGEEPRLLLSSTDIGIYDISALAASFGGVAWPAHINRPALSLFSNLGVWDKKLGFPLAECDQLCPADFFPRHPDLLGISVITGSDAHGLDQIAQASRAMEVPTVTPGAVLDWLRRGGRNPSARS